MFPFQGLCSEERRNGFPKMVQPDQWDPLNCRQSVPDCTDCYSNYVNKTQDHAVSWDEKPNPHNGSPNRDNITYAVQVITPDPARTFKTLVQELKEHKGLTERTIIYCQTIKVTTFLYSFFMSELGDDMYIRDLKIEVWPSYRKRQTAVCS